MKKVIVFFILLIFVGNAIGQVAISDTFSAPSPNNSAILDLQSFERGLLPPRMNQTQRDGINSPADGLMIFNTSTQCAEIFIQGLWKTVACACSVAPSTPGPITGPTSVCPNQVGVAYSVSSDPNASSYSWTVPTGASITSGQGTNSIVIDFGSSSGNVSVTASNVCGTSSSQSQSIAVQSADASFTVNPSSPQINNAANFSASVSGQTYQWTFPSGSPSSSASQNPSVTWTVAGTYDVILQVARTGGCSDADTQSVVVQNCPNPTGSQTFNYTGTMQTFTVPNCVDTLTIDMYGASGGNGQNGSRGLGGRVQCKLGVNPGEVLNIFIGAQGTNGSGSSGGNGGYNGGGSASGYSNTCYTGGGGGGASDIRIGGSALTDRVVVAGAGGGGGGNPCTCGGVCGGHGGGLTATMPCSNCNNANGGPASQVSGGVGGTWGPGGQPGTLGNGGNSSTQAGGGGGGGYYGGGGGGHGAGGGGSSYTDSSRANNVTHSTGVHTGNGTLTITW